MQGLCGYFEKYSSSTSVVFSCLASKDENRVLLILQGSDSYCSLLVPHKEVSCQTAARSLDISDYNSVTYFSLT